MGNLLELEEKDQQFEAKISDYQDRLNKNLTAVINKFSPAFAEECKQSISIDKEESEGYEDVESEEYD